MKLILLCTSIVVIWTFIPVAGGQEFFWSDHSFLGGAVNENFQLVTTPGESGRLYLYYEAFGQDITEGIDLDFSWNRSGVAGFAAAATVDFDIYVAVVNAGKRWGDFSGQAQSVQQNEVHGFLAANVIQGYGIQHDFNGVDSIFSDAGYDDSNDSFLVGYIDWFAIESGETFLRIDDSVIANLGQNIDVSFKGLSVRVVPETSSSLVAALLLFCINFRRYRTD